VTCDEGGLGDPGGAILVKSYDSALQQGVS